MATIERVCPNCGTSNSSQRARCSKCGTTLTNLPARGQSQVPARGQKAEIAGLALSAGALIARAGFRLFVRQVLPRMRGRNQKPSAMTIDQEPRRNDVERPQSGWPEKDDSPDYVIRGWRAWSVRRNEDESSGSESFEWRVSRRRDGGAEDD